MERSLKIIILLLVVTQNSFAKSGSETSASAATKVNYEKKTKLDFSEKSVDGEFLNPDSSAVGGDQNIGFDSLLEPKSDFKKELKRSSKAVR